MKSEKEPAYRSVFEFLLGFSLCLFLFICPWFYGLTELKSQLLAELTVFGLALLAIIFSGLTIAGKSRQDLSKLDFWIFASSLFSLFHIVISAYPYQSALTWLRLFACVLFYFLIRETVKNEKSFQSFLWVFVSVGVFYASYGLLQYYGFLPKSFWFIAEHLASRYVNGGHFAAFLIIPIFSGIALLLTRRSLVIKMVLTGFLILMGGALLLSRSRTVWMAIPAGFLVLIFFLLLYRILSRGLWISLGFLAFSGLIFFLIRGGTDMIAERFGQLSNFNFYSLMYRADLWKGCWEAIKDRPWGWGMGTFSVIFPQFRIQSDRFFVLYAHNEFFQTGVDLGWAGIVFLALFIFYYFRNAISFLKTEIIASPRKIYGICFLAAAVALFFSAQSDFALRIYATSFFLSAFLALSAYLFSGRTLSSGESPHRRAVIFRAVSFLLVLLAGTLSARQLFAEIHFEKAMSLENKYLWSSALKEYKLAIQLAPFYARFRARLGEFYEKQSSVALKSDLKKTLRQQAIQSYQEAIRIFPYWPDYHYQLALLYEENQELSLAQDEFKKAIDLDPTNGYFVSEYGFFALRHSIKDEALNAFEEIRKIAYYEGSTYHKIGLCETLRKVFQVVPDYDDLRRVIPDTWQGHQCLGVVLAENAQWGPAKREFDRTLNQARQAMELDFYHDHVRSAVVRLYMSLGRLEDALDIYKKAVRNDTNDIRAREQLEAISQIIYSAGKVH